MGIFHIHVGAGSGREEKGSCTPIKTGSSIKGELEEWRGMAECSAAGSARLNEWKSRAARPQNAPLEVRQLLVYFGIKHSGFNS